MCSGWKHPTLLLFGRGIQDPVWLQLQLRSHYFLSLLSVECGFSSGLRAIERSRKERQTLQMKLEVEHIQAIYESI